MLAQVFSRVLKYLLSWSPERNEDFLLDFRVLIFPAQIHPSSYLDKSSMGRTMLATPEKFPSVIKTSVCDQGTVSNKICNYLTIIAGVDNKKYRKRFTDFCLYLDLHLWHFLYVVSYYIPRLIMLKRKKSGHWTNKCSIETK